MSAVTITRTRRTVGERCQDLAGADPGDQCRDRDRRRPPRRLGPIEDQTVNARRPAQSPRPDTSCDASSVRTFALADRDDQLGEASTHFDIVTPGTVSRA